MSKKTTKSGGLKSIKGGKSGGGYGVSNGSGHSNGHDPHEDSFPNGNTDQPQTPEPTGPSKIVDFTTARAQRNLDNRRSVERFFLQHMIDVYCETEGGQQRMPIEVVEVSETGCSFRLTPEKAQSLPRDTTGALLPLQVRFYFSRESYLRIGLFVINANREIGKIGNSTRFGCRIDETFASADAYRQFVRFMEQFAKHAMRDSKQISNY